MFGQCPLWLLAVGAVVEEDDGAGVDELVDD
jgi:hypothetical protein